MTTTHTHVPAAVTAASERGDTVALDGATVTIDDVHAVATRGAACVLAPGARERVAAARERITEHLASGEPVYGVTTGYGEMIYMHVDPAHDVALQHNLVRSHSAGCGPLLSPAETRAVMVARANAFAKGYSGVRPDVVERILQYLRLGVVPAIPEYGSLGASGDLAPLSHLASALIGEGYVIEDGRRTPTADYLERTGIPGFSLQFKEGLSLINGTSAMTGVGSLVLHRAQRQVRDAEAVAALVLEALRASTGPFEAPGHDLARPHRGQVASAAAMRSLLAGSTGVVGHAELRAEASADAAAARAADEGGRVGRTGTYLQKAYTMRAIPQILGAVRDTLDHAVAVVTTELNSANDNPLVFEGEEVFHGANFHGQPVAFAMDFTTIALTQLGVQSERRTNRLLNRHLSGLPEFLVARDPGLNSGFAGLQYSATALVAENRTIAPASTQSVPSNGDNQDVVSMGLIAARNARRVCANNEYILAVEAIAAAQAAELAGAVPRLSPAGAATYRRIRSWCTTMDEDRYLADDLERVAAGLASNGLGPTADGGAA